MNEYHEAERLLAWLNDHDGDDVIPRLAVWLDAHDDRVLAALAPAPAPDDAEGKA